MTDCIFCKIVAGQIPARKVYEDEEMLAFHDIQPLARVHILLIPKRHVAALTDCTADDAALLGRLLLRGTQLAKELGLPEGFKTAINTGRGGGQLVFHLHVHIYGGGPVARE